MKEINNQLNLSTIYTENFYRLTLSIKLNIKVFAIFLLDMLTKIKTNLFYKYEQKNKIKLS